MIPTRIRFDPSTNVYTNQGLLRIFTQNGPDWVDPREWIDWYYATSNASHYWQAFQDAVMDGLVDDDTEGRLAWMDLYSQGKVIRNADGSFGWKRPREQALTVWLYCNRAVERLYPLPDGKRPFPASITAAEGWTSWEQVK